MSSKQKNKAHKALKYLIIFTIVIFVILQVILISLKKSYNEEEQMSDTQVQVDLEKAKTAENDVILKKLSEMGERDRMEYYFSVFIKTIEANEYEQAYDMLYEEYKKNYFPNIESFEEYVRKTFPKMSTIEHTNIERSGDTYILFITISDSLSLSANEGKEMKVVIKEEDLNDFVMSFSVI